MKGWRPRIGVRRGLTVGTAALLVVVAVALAVGFGVRYAGTRADRDAGADAVAAARRYSQAMFGFAPNTVDANIVSTREALVGEARSTYEDILGTSSLAAEVKSQKVTSQVSVQDAGLVSGDEHSATVLMFLNQSVTKGDSQYVQVEPSRVQYTMRTSADRWVISSIEVITDDSLRGKLHLGPPPASSAAPALPSAVPAPVPSAAPAPG